MKHQSTSENVVGDMTANVTRLAETAIQAAWSLMDAATEKLPPSRQLSQTAIQSIRGIDPPDRQLGSNNNSDVQTR